MAELLTVSGVTKRFGTLTALDSVSTQFRSGEIHAVVGENGAGKSTLASVIAGFVAPDSGEVRLDEFDVPLGRPFESKALGIEMIHQHFTLVPEFTVEENLALPAVDRLATRLDVPGLAAPALNIAERLGWNVEPTAKVRTLSVGIQQRVEILKALASQAQVLIFDEPTAVLAQGEVDELMRVLFTLREEGRIVVLIAHKLTEVMAAADRVTVLRKGRVVATATRGEFDPGKLADWMVGEMPVSPVSTRTSSVQEGLVVRNLEVQGDRGEMAVRGVSFEVGKGEILGIGGVDGNGQLELAEAIAQVRPIKTAEELSFGRKDFPSMAIGYIPQDRRRDGLALGMSVMENMLVSARRRPEFIDGPFLSTSRVKDWASDLVSRFSISSPRIGSPVSDLSGGNQQKVVVSRNLDQVPDLLVVAGPTRGLDLKATAYVHSKICEARDAGAAVLLFSSDLDELASVADRTMFMGSGRLMAGSGPVAVVGGEV